MGLADCTNLSGSHACGSRLIKTLKTDYGHKNESKINKRHLFKEPNRCMGILRYEFTIFFYESLSFCYEKWFKILLKSYSLYLIHSVCLLPAIQDDLGEIKCLSLKFAWNLSLINMCLKSRQTLCTTKVPL